MRLLLLIGVLAGIAWEVKPFQIWILLLIFIAAASYLVNRLIIRRSYISRKTYVSLGIITVIVPFLLLGVVAVVYLLTSYNGMCWEMCLYGHDFYYPCSFKEYFGFYASRVQCLIFPAIIIHSI
jgi:hypothetical protein